MVLCLVRGRTLPRYLWLQSSRVSVGIAPPLAHGLCILPWEHRTPLTTKLYGCKQELEKTTSLNSQTTLICSFFLSATACRNCVIRSICAIHTTCCWDIKLFLLLCSQLDLWGSPVFVRFLRICLFLNPTIEVVTFFLHGWTSSNQETNIFMALVHFDIYIVQVQVPVVHTFCSSARLQGHWVVPLLSPTHPKELQ